MQKDPSSSRPGRGAVWGIGAVAAGLAVAVFQLPAIPQPDAYHDFADQRGWLGLPHFANTVSNAGFLLVGALGIRISAGGSGIDAPVFQPRADRLPWLVFFVAAVGIGLGSGYYHLDPGPDRLFWDRLPMAVAFTALLAAILRERTPAPSGPAAAWLPLCVLAGVLATVYWYATELAGAGDLRPYLLVQAIPLVIGPLSVLLLPSRYDRNRDFLPATGLYLLALGADRLDAAIHHGTGGAVSGHTLKHVLATLAMVAMIRMLCRRRAARERG